MIRGAMAGPRLLLRRLRHVMAEPVDAQARLDKIVVLIAANMVAEVCSVYLQTRKGTLELSATEGLNKDAVHHTQLQVGEGLVGLIAADGEPIALSDARSHAAFAYRPETGEERFHSFLGVPILRGGAILGVLVVQNRTRRRYSEEEIEALQTTAMVLAEMVATGELTALTASRNGAIGTAQNIIGLSLSPGLALGRALLHEPRVVVTNLIAESVVVERDRLERALNGLRGWTDEMFERGDVARAGEHRDVLETYRMFAHDRGWANRLRETVENGLTAEAAVERVQGQMRARMMQRTDPLLRERLHDLDDLSNRLLRLLSGRPITAMPEEIPDNAVLIARSMGPAELLDYDRRKLRALVLAEGAPTSHVAIVARALGLVAVAQVHDIVRNAEAGDAIIVDGDAGEVHLRPASDVEEAYADKLRFHAKRQAQYRALRRRPAISRDGERVRLLMNAGLAVELPHLRESGACGIGLFRTELQFMLAAALPRMNAQLNMYRSVIEAVGDKPIIFRSLDIGGDKVLPYLRQMPEENPALGWRAIRMALDRPALLRTQIRALLHAAAGRSLAIMFPMVTDCAEFDQAKALVMRELDHLRRHGRPEPTEIRLGAMLEVPALLWQLDELFTRVDFASIGSNDLLQFMWACDRSNARLANRFDPLSAPTLRALRHIVERAVAHNVPLTLCGELAGEPLGAMALQAIGIRSLSMPPAAIGPVKAMTLKLDVNLLSGQVLERLAQTDAGSLRPFLKEFAARKGVPI